VTAVDAIAALRVAVAAASSVEDAAVRSASTSSEFTGVDVVRIPGESALDYVAVRLAGPAGLPELEAAFGPSRRLPMAPDDGATRTVIFEGTLPPEGSTGATLLADVQDGVITRLVLRRDVL
jgi:hypothetical protein